MHRVQKISQIARRCFSAQVQAAQSDGHSVSYSCLENGLKIATCNENALGARVALLVNTGCRDDSGSELGLTHCLQAAAGLKSENNTSFLTTQLLSALGSDLEVVATRDSILYNIGCYETTANEVILNVLVPSLKGAKFPRWELQDHVVKRMKYQKAYAENDPLYVLMESVHKASFRGGVGHPLLSPDFMMGKHTTDMLMARLQSSFALNNMVLAGSGISHGALKEIGRQIEGFPTALGSPLSREAAPFISSEFHADRSDDISYAAITFEGLGLNDNDVLASSVLQHALGTQTNIKRGSGLVNGVLNHAVGKSTTFPFSTSAFSVNYSDCGLFGVTVAAPNENLTQIVSLVGAELRVVARDGVVREVVESAKRRLKLKVLSESESSQAVGDVASQASILNTVVTPHRMVEMIDAVTHDEVKSAAQRILNGKRSLATVGHARNRPVLGDL